MKITEANLEGLKTPCYVLNESLLIKNLEKLKDIEDKTGCHILLAQKAFSMYSEYPLVSKYISGVTSSSLFEARLGYEEMKKEVHIYAPAYREDEIDDILKYSDHIVFNSFNQYRKYKNIIKNYKGKKIECGIRINPEYSEIETDIYNPCFKNSRLGVTLYNFNEENLEGIDGLHFHCMCEENSDTLERIIRVVEEKFGKYFNRIKWINFGGGHHITREDYDVQKLVNCILYIKNKYNLEVYIEPGEAVALNTGYLVSEVLDIVSNNMNIAIMDTSAACHMPDVLEMPYRPNIIGSGMKDKYKYTYRLGGPTCLAGDIIGDYSFKEPLRVGDKLIFCDMAIYSMVKNNTFNGINLPDIVVLNNKGFKVVKKFGYEDFRSRI